MVEKKIKKWWKIDLCIFNSKVKWLSWIFGPIGVYFFIRGFLTNSWGAAILGVLFLGAADIIQTEYRIKKIEERLEGGTK